MICEDTPLPVEDLTADDITVGTKPGGLQSSEPGLDPDYRNTSGSVTGSLSGLMEPKLNSELTQLWQHLASRLLGFDATSFA